MRWTDIEKSATDYQTLLAEREENESQLQAMQQEANKKLELQKQIEALNILDILHTRDALEAIRDDVWGEGVIEKTQATGSNASLYGLQLKSEPYHLFQVRFHKDKKHLLLDTLHDTTCLRVLADIKQESNPYIYVKFGPFRSNVYDFNRIDEKDIRCLTLQQGLKKAVIAKTHLPEAYTDQFTIIHSGEESTQPLYRALYTLVSQQKEMNSLPHQIREWGEDFLQQLPEQLQKGGVMHKKEIHTWERQVMGVRRYYPYSIGRFLKILNP